MTLEKIYNKWLSIQPLSEADQNKLSMRFTVEFNYNANKASLECKEALF